MNKGRSDETPERPLPYLNSRKQQQYLSGVNCIFFRYHLIKIKFHSRIIYIKMGK